MSRSNRFRRRSSLGGSPPSRRSRLLTRGFPLLLLLLGLWCLFGVAPAPTIEMALEPRGIGPRSTVLVQASEPRFGLTSVELILEQGEQREVVAAETFQPRPLWWPWGEKAGQATVTAEVGHRLQGWLENGEARLFARSTRLAGRFRSPAPTEAVLTVPVRVTPPELAVLSDQIWVRQGGAEVVVYSVEDNAVRHGVQAGEFWFPGSQLPGGGGESFTFFSAPWHLDSDDNILLVAEDALGNRIEQPFVDRFVPRPVGTSSISLSDGFLERVVPPIVARVPGLEAGETALETYLEINGRLRAENRQLLVELGAQSVDSFLWSEAFLPFPGGQVMDAFARRRAYRYNGDTVDEQVHLGYDLASVSRAAVPAANPGRVLLADFLGIYGNVVVLDHGFGLMSLYAHLSSLDVASGDTVTRGQPLGRTGTTGLAGGDHLHFATLLRGLPVDAVEWWDAHWIEDRLGRKLGPALPFEAARR